MSKKPVILFDGVCNLCNSTVDILLKYDKKNQFRYVPLQSNEGQELVQKYRVKLNVDSVLLIHSGKVYDESDAVIEIAKMLNYPLKLIVLGRYVPKKIRNSAYAFIAKNRYRWFGKRATCRVLPQK